MCNVYIMQKSVPLLAGRRMLLWRLGFFIIIFLISSFAYAAQRVVVNTAPAASTGTLNDGGNNDSAVHENDLLTQLNGVIVVQNNQKSRSNTPHLEVEQVNPDWRTRFLALITDPTIAYLLLLLGIYGIFFEAINPGYVLPGAVGAVSMFIALYALLLLPINYVGLSLIILGVLCIISEVFIPAYGALGGGGTVAFVLGSLMLIEPSNQIYHITRAVIWAMAVVNILILVFVLRMVVQARRQSVKHGVQVLLGVKGRAFTDINLEGQVLICGEIWSARSQCFIAKGQSINVIGASGLVLEVEEEKE